jgi:hypothetical protein
MKKITTIINYCTNDYIFLKPCVDAALKVSHKVIVPFCTHFHDGTEQDRALLLRSVGENPNAEFIEFDYCSTESSRWHCNISRKIGIEVAPDDTDYFMFLDTDEIVVPEEFNAWWSEQQSKLLVSYKLANYFYFRDFKYQCKESQDSIALVQKGTYTSDQFILHENERSGVFDYVPYELRARNVTHNGKPFIHHYSWVRSKETMLKKVSCWSHNKDKDWTALVHQEFSEPFRGKDVIFGFEYNTVEPYLNLKIE